MKKLQSIITSLVILTISNATFGAEDKWFSLSSLFDFGEDEAAKPIAWNNIKTASYDKIDVGSDINLLIDPKHKYSVTIKEPDVTAYVKNNTLYLKGNCISETNCNKNHNAYMRDISNVKYMHTKYNAKVYGKQLKKHDQAMTIYSEDNSSVVLEGMMNINKIQHDSTAISKILWLNAENTSILASRGFLKIAGATDNVNIRARNKAYVDAIRLRAKNSWVSTVDRSTVGIDALNYLYAHSENNSMIRYATQLRDTVFITKDHSKIINTKLDPSYPTKR